MRSRLAGAAVVVALALAAACGTDSSTATPTTASDAASEASLAPSAANSADSAASAPRDATAPDGDAGDDGACASCATDAAIVDAGAASQPIANIDFENEAGVGMYSAAALADPDVGAIDVNLDWSSIEADAGVFDFSSVDSEVQAWTQKGKKVVLVIRYIKEKAGRCTNPQRTPAWIAKPNPDGGFPLNEFCDTYTGAVIPDYFDPDFKTALKAYVRAIADHFAPIASSILYVRAGVGLGSEGFYIFPCSAADVDAGCAAAEYRQQLVTWGLSPEAWRDWQEEMLTSFRASFSYATVMYALVNLDALPDGGSIEQDVAYWAAAKVDDDGGRAMGVGALGLQPGFDTGAAHLGALFTALHAAHPDLYIHLQPVSYVGDGGTLAADIALAKKYGARSVEWYAQDIENPAYTAQLTAWQAFDSDASAGGDAAVRP